MPIPVETLLANVDAMRRLAQAVVHDPDRADDVTQTAILTAIRRPPRSQGNVRGWLFRVVRNAARDARRRERRQFVRDRNAARPDRAPDASSMAEQIDTQKDLLGAVLTLSESYREVVWLRYFEGLPPRRVAERLSIPVETVRTRHRRALQQLRTQLDDQHRGRRDRWKLALLPIVGAPGAGSPWLMGVGLMAGKTKTFTWVAAVVLALVAGGIFLASLDAPSPTDRTATPTTASRDGPGLTGIAKEVDDASDAEDETPEFAADSEHVRTRGIVLDERGQPLAGAQIAISAASERRLVARTDATSGKDGTFAINWNDTQSEGGYRIVARAPGRRCDAVRFVDGRAPPAFVTFRLPRVRTLAFVVRDGDTDKPIPFATITAHTMAGVTQITIERRADEGGRVTLPSPHSHDLRLALPMRVAAPGYRPLKELPGAVAARGGASAKRPRDIYLFKAPNWRLRVVDAAGNPVAGASVQAWAGGSHGLFLDPRTDVRPLGEIPVPDPSRVLPTKLSDASGHVSYAALAEGLTWHARATDEAGRVGYGYGGGTRTLVLHPAYEVIAEVVDEAGEPVAQATVQCWPPLWVKAMKAGSFRMPPKDLQLLHSQITDEAGLARFQVLDIEAQQEFTVRRGDIGIATAPVPERPDAGAARVRVVLQRRHPGIPVQVTDTVGSPVAGALVSYRNMSPGVLTRVDGRATLFGLPEAHGPMLSIVAQKRGYAWTRAAVPKPGEALTLVLRPEQVLQGRVVDVDGTGISAYIDFYKGEVADLSEAERKERAQLYREDWLGRAHADADGHFRRAGLPPGPWYVSAGTPRSGSYHWRIVNRLVPSADEPVTLTLPPHETPEAPTGALEGEVRLTDGSLLTKYSVWLRAEKWTYRPVLVGRRFLFEDVPAGTYTLGATAPGGRGRVETPVTVIAGRTEQAQITLGKSYTLRARLLAPNGTALAWYFVRTYRQDTMREDAGVQTDKDGWFQVEHRLAGTYLVHLSAPQDRPAFELKDARVRVGPGTEPPTLKAIAAARLVLSLDDERFQEAAKGFEDRFSRRGQATWHTQIRLTDVSGHTRRSFGLFHGRRAAEWALLPGRYHLAIESREHGRFETDLDVTDAADVVVQVRLNK